VRSPVLGSTLPGNSTLRCCTLLLLLLLMMLLLLLIPALHCKEVLCHKYCKSTASASACSGIVLSV
jgi:hypothetical protein